MHTDVIAVVASAARGYQMPPIIGKIKDRNNAVERSQVEVVTSLGTVTRDEDSVLSPRKETYVASAIDVVCVHARCRVPRRSEYDPPPWDVFFLGKRGEGHIRICPSVSTINGFEIGQSYAASPGRSSAWHQTG